MTSAKNDFIGLYHENCYLVGGNEPLVGGGESTEEEFLLVVGRGGKSKFLASGGNSPQSMENPAS